MWLNLNYILFTEQHFFACTKKSLKITLITDPNMNIFKITVITSKKNLKIKNFLRSRSRIPGVPPTFSE